MVTKRIGLAGAAGSGKTTAANYLVNEHGFAILGFATPLYLLGDIHREDPREYNGRLHDWTETYLKPVGFRFRDRIRFMNDARQIMHDVPVVQGKNRTLLQLLGTEVGRALDENLWTKIFEQAVNRQGEDFRVVNDNLRFPNEFDCLERMKFRTIYLDVPLEVRAERYEREYGVPMDEAQLSHASEAYLEEMKERCEFVFDNTAEEHKLYKFLDSTVNKSSHPMEV